MSIIIAEDTKYPLNLTHAFVLFRPELQIHKSVCGRDFYTSALRNRGEYSTGVAHEVVHCLECQRRLQGKEVDQ